MDLLNSFKVYFNEIYFNSEILFINFKFMNKI